MPHQPCFPVTALPECHRARGLGHQLGFEKISVYGPEGTDFYVLCVCEAQALD